MFARESTKACFDKSNTNVEILTTVAAVVPYRSCWWTNCWLAACSRRSDIRLLAEKYKLFRVETSWNSVFPLPALRLNRVFVLLQMHFTVTTDMKLTFILTKVHLKFVFLIFCYCSMTESVSWCTIRVIFTQTREHANGYEIWTECQ